VGLNAQVLRLEVFNDFAASSVNSIFEDALGTKLAIQLIPVSGTVTATNPRYSMSVLVAQWQPINGSIDSPMTASITLPVTALTKATS
jgi:hypothetical protein